MGRHKMRIQEPARPYPPLGADYFRGINYVLNEQPDKAIEAFIRVLEVDSETAETHLALGRLYRQRGEVDRAIRIHQNLIARETLQLGQRHAALLELGRDYSTAGLLDRAEAVYAELVESDGYQVQALQQLTEIYEQEKDWDRAVSTVRRLEQATGRSLAPVIAQYYCERAERSRLERSPDAALASVSTRNVPALVCLKEISKLIGRNGSPPFPPTGELNSRIRSTFRKPSRDCDTVAPESVDPDRYSNISAKFWIGMGGLR